MIGAPIAAVPLSTSLTKNPTVGFHRLIQNPTQRVCVETTASMPERDCSDAVPFFESHRSNHPPFRRPQVSFLI